MCRAAWHRRTMIEMSHACIGQDPGSSGARHDYGIDRARVVSSGRRARHVEKGHPMFGDTAVPEEDAASPVIQQSLAAWRASLATLRDKERRHGTALSPETGRLLETVGQALAQGGGALPAADVSALEVLTGIPARYRVMA